MPYFLKILAAPDADLLGRKFALEEGENVVGRIAPPCRIVLNGTKVSKRHCTFKVSGTSLSVRDDNSSNGVYVNGTKVTAAELKEKDRLVVGEYTLEVTGK